MTNQDNYFATSDLALTAVLSLFYPIETIEKSNPYKAQFIFKKDKDLEHVISKYWIRKLPIDALTFFNQIKIVKARLYGEN